MDSAARILELEAIVASNADNAARIRELEAIVAAKDAEISALKTAMAELQKKLDAVLALLAQNSGNSNKPPSTDKPGGRPPATTNPSGRKPGGQKGHKGHWRQMAGPEKVNKIVDVYPAECENCWSPLPEMPELNPQRFQLAELPPVVPHITEWRGHSVTCSCGHTTKASLADRVPASPFGPRLAGLVGLLTGVYHISRRQCRSLLGDVLGINISLGSVSQVEKRVSEALKPAVEQIEKAIDAAPVKHADGTSWLQKNKLCSLWTLATAAATLFAVFVNGSIESIKPFFGTCKGILVSDRATVFSFWSMTLRQICWSHLKRKFQWFAEQTGKIQEFGKQLLEYEALVFRYWHDFRDGTIDREVFVLRMAALTPQVENYLQKAVDAQIDGLSGSCADILEHKLALWTFVHTKGVEPTNNHAEQELRSFVLWRKRCFGTQSDRGNEFAVRIMSVAHTSRKQHRNVFEYIVACCTAAADKTSIPSLFGTSVVA